MNYDRLFTIKSQHRDAVTAQINNNEIVSRERSVYFAFDKTDLKRQTTDGRNQLHGTASQLIKKKQPQKFQNTCLFTVKTNQSKSINQFMISNIVPSQFTRTTITQSTNSTFPKKLRECNVITR